MKLKKILRFVFIPVILIMGLASFFVPTETLQIRAFAHLKINAVQANINGDKLTLTLENVSGSSYSGILNDSYEDSPVVLELSGTSFNGVVTETSEGIDIHVNGEIIGDQLLFNFIVDPLGETDPIEVRFIRDGSKVPSPATTGDQNQPILDFPSGAFHPLEIIGTWSKEELYQSGSGDNYMGAGFTQSMTFLPDGHIAEGGSSANISGSNYFGQSAGQGAGVIPGLAWYTIDNKIYLQITDNGQTQNVQLGTYYIEGNNMLITGTSGEKILLTKKN